LKPNHWHARKSWPKEWRKFLMAKAFSDVTVALALLTSGAIHQHADEADKARELVKLVHYLEERFLASVYGSSLDLQ
jgi:hypothetical protein